jgi:hypothetical protein
MHRRRARNDRVPDAEAAQKINVPRTEGIDAYIEALARIASRGCADERQRQLRQRAREACADRAAPDDDEIDAARVYNAFP